MVMKEHATEKEYALWLLTDTDLLCSAAESDGGENGHSGVK